MVLSAVIWSPLPGTEISQATLGNSSGGTFIIGDLAETSGGYNHWAIQNAAHTYPSTKLVLANVPTCLVAQIDFSVSGGMDRMRLWVNPPPTGFLPVPDIDVTTAHVALFSGVFWQTQNGQTVDEISVTSGPTQALNCVNPPNTTMVAWYPFDETNPGAGMSANLASGNTGLWSTTPYTFPTPIPGKVAGALNFDGFSNYVDSPSTIATNFGPGVASPVWCSGDYSTCQGDFSIDTWLNVPSIPSGVATIVDKRSGTLPLIHGYAFYLRDNTLGLQLADGGAGAGFTNYETSGLALVPGSWNHVAVTVHRVLSSPAGIRFYLNGVLVWTANPSGRPGSLVNNSPLRIGANIWENPPIAWFLGSLDELEIFNRELSAAEVWSIYNAQQYGKCKP